MHPTVHIALLSAYSLGENAKAAPMRAIIALAPTSLAFCTLQGRIGKPAAVHPVRSQSKFNWYFHY